MTPHSANAAQATVLYDAIKVAWMEKINSLSEYDPERGFGVNH